MGLVQSTKTLSPEIDKKNSKKNLQNPPPRVGARKYEQKHRNKQILAIIHGFPFFCCFSGPNWDGGIS